MAISTWPKTLQQAVVYFSNRDNAHAAMVNFRWPDGNVKCPTCGSEKVYFAKSRRIWECKEKHAKRQFSVKVGTIFEDSPIGLESGCCRLADHSAKNGISSYELAASLGVTQKTAWFMLHRIRLAMQAETEKFSGHVEVDETFIGGKRSLHAQGRSVTA